VTAKAPATEVGTDIHRPDNDKGKEQEPRRGVRCLSTQILNGDSRRRDQHDADTQQTHIGVGHRRVSRARLEQQGHQQPEQQNRAEEQPQHSITKRQVKADQGTQAHQDGKEHFAGVGLDTGKTPPLPTGGRAQQGNTERKQPARRIEQIQRKDHQHDHRCRYSSLKHP